MPLDETKLIKNVKLTQKAQEVKNKTLKSIQYSMYKSNRKELFACLDEIKVCFLSNDYCLVQDLIKSKYKDLYTKSSNYSQLNFKKDPLFLIKEALNNNEVAINFLCKDSERQSIREIYALSRLLKNNFDAYALDKKNLSIIKGKLQFEKSKKISTVDFIAKKDNKVFLVHHRYIGTQGGSQIRSFKELCSLTKHTKECVVGIIILVDGNYFTEAKINELKTCNPKAQIIKVDSLN